MFVASQNFEWMLALQRLMQDPQQGFELWRQEVHYLQCVARLKKAPGGFEFFWSSTETFLFSEWTQYMAFNVILETCLTMGDLREHRRLLLSSKEVRDLFLRRLMERHSVSPY